MVLQLKLATNLIPSKCYEEILKPAVENENRQLKGEIETLVIENGCYILFTTQAIVDNGKTKRVEEFRRAIKDAGHANWASLTIDVYDANKIKDWTNQFLSAVVFVQRCNNITRPLGFRSWDELRFDVKETATPFQSNTVVEANILGIKTSIQNEKVLRISGHSGLGKTRLLLESFRPDVHLSIFPSDMTYYDVGMSANSAEIANYIVSHRNYQHGIIVVDNCDAETHDKLSEIIKAIGHLKLITIGFDSRRSSQDLHIRLDRNNQRDLVALIVDQKLSQSHSQTDREYIKTLSEGYPWMAVKFCDSVIKQGMTNLSQYPLEDFIRKLLFGTDKLEYDIICACSVFSAFGFMDDSLLGLINNDLAKTLQAQMDFIREKIYDGSITDSRFREICNKFRTEDIIEKRGTFYIVKPTILAANLASHWLTITSPDTIKSIIEILKNVSLEEKFLARLTDLDQMDKAKNLVEDLWGENGFFGSAEVLSTAWGSLLFRYVVEVNPTATINSLDKAFFNKSIQELKTLLEPRRNLVWSLEKLVFREVTFEKAAKFLYKFAVAENETWANNATHQFAQLFQVHLAGTSANYNQRLDIINWGLAQNDNEYTRIAILAMGRGLRYDDFSRSGGAEKQGSGAPLQDYQPLTWQEIEEYWTSILNLLIPIAKANTPNSVIAKNVIAKSIRSLFAKGMFGLIDTSIRKIIDGGADFWPEAVESLRRALQYEKHLPHPHQAVINELINVLTPKDLKTRIYLNVSKPGWSYSTPEDFSGQKQLDNVKKLAEEIVTSNSTLDELLPHLLKGEQRQGYNFGYALGELLQEPRTLLINALGVLKTIPKNEQNPEFIAGFAIGANDSNLVELVYQTFLSTEQVAHHSFYFAKAAKMRFADIEKLFDIIDNFNLPITYFSSFQYGRASDDFSVEELFKLCTKLKTYGLAGRWTGLSILFMYCFAAPERWDTCQEFIKGFVSEINMGITVNSVYSVEGFHWSETIEKVLLASKDDEFAKTMMRQIIEMSSDYSMRSQLDHYIPKVIQTLLENYFEETWDLLGNALISDNHALILNFRHSIGTENGHNGLIGVLFQNDERNKLLFEWARNHPQIAPKRFANMMPLSTVIDSQLTWHPFAQKIIDTFGNQEAVLSELSANMGTYGSVGSSVDYLEMLRDLTGKLFDHPLSEVREWARRYFQYMEKQIKLEKISNEEDFLT